MIDKLLILLILSLPFGQLTRITLFSPEIHFYLHDLIIAFLIILGLIKKKFNFKKIFKGNLTKPILAFFLVGLFSLLVNLQKHQILQVFISSLYLFRWLAYVFVYWFCLELPPKRKPKFYKLLICSSLALAIFGLIQYFLYPDFRPFEVYHWDPHYYRLLSTLLDPGFTGMIFVLGLILLVCYFWKEFQKSKINVYHLIFLIIYIALALTYARSAYFAYMVGFLVISLRKKTPRLFLFLLTLGVITVLLLPRPGGEGVRLERTTSIEARLINWQQGFKIIRNNPVFGVGFNTLRYVQKDYGFLGDDWQYSHAGAGLDSSLLFVLATTGLVGFLVFLWFFKVALADKSLIIEASLIALITHSFFNNTLFYPWAMLWLWIIFALEEIRGNKRL